MSEDIVTSGFAQLQMPQEELVTVEELSAYLAPQRKKKHEKYIHISTPSLTKQAMFGVTATKLVNAKGTLCKKCEQKKLAAR